MAQTSKMKIPAHPETREADRDPTTGAPGTRPVGTGPGAAEAVNSSAEDAFWREHYTTSRAYEQGSDYERYQPAYRAGYLGWSQYGAGGRSFEEAEPQLRSGYEREVGDAGLAWEKARLASREAWERVRGSRGGMSTGVGSGSASAGAQRTAAAVSEPMSKQSLSQLDSFLRGELSAIGTYSMALTRLAESSHTGALREALASHERRADKLRDHIRSGGGQPAENAGVWGAFAKLYEGGMALFGEKSAINALESGEDHGIADFKRGLDDLDPVCLDFMRREILPEQERTHRLISDLKHSL